MVVAVPVYSREREDKKAFKGAVFENGSKSKRYQVTTTYPLEETNKNRL